MQEAVFTLQTITPLFMAGADQMGAEVRAPSFRGPMRYWYRAMVSGLLGTQPTALPKLREAEGELFGVTDKGSAVQLRILDAPTETRRLDKSGTAKDYLFWSVMMRPSRPCFLPGTQFSVLLSARGADDEKKALNRAVSAFWLLSHLGGVGSRSRRCAGNFSVTKAKEDSFGFGFHQPATLEKLCEQLEQGIARCRVLYNNQLQVAEQKAFYDSLAPGACKIWLLCDGDRPWSDRNQALNDIGASMQNYRRTLPLPKRKIFGLPVMEKKYDGRTSPMLITGAGSKAPRVASPIHLHISELQTRQGRKYAGVATLFKTRWEDMSDAEYQLYDFIENWIDKDFSQAIKVQL